jgi:2-phosphoglycerate kinase
MATPNVELHVIYGIPCVGKSTAAVELAFHRDIRTIVQTDYVREVQRLFTPSEQAPALAKVTHTAWELYGPPTRSNIEAGFLDHAQAVAVGIQAVAKKLVGDGFAAVIEGAHFHGSIIEELRAANDSAEVEATLLVVEAAEELHQRISHKESQRARGAAQKLWRDNIPIMLAIQDFLISDARTHRIRVATAEEWRHSCAPAVSRYSTSTTS